MILRVPPGWQATEEGYWLNTSALQLLVADGESWEQTAGVWEASYNDLFERYQTYIKSSRARLEALQADIEAERSQWQKAVKAERTRPGLGIFGGYGVGGFTVGVGIVWRVM